MIYTLKKASLGLAAAGVLLASSSAFATSVTNNAAVVILKPLVLTANNDMNFGKVTKPATSGTVVLTSGGAISTTGGIVTLGGTPAAGTVSINGDSAGTVGITVTNTTSLPGLTLSNFTNSTPFGGKTLSGSGTATLSGATLTGGTDTLTLGATLNINAAAVGFTTGAKTLTYSVDVVYE